MKALVVLVGLVGVAMLFGCSTLESTMGSHREQASTRVSLTAKGIRVTGVQQAAGATVPAVSIVIGETTVANEDSEQAGASIEAEAEATAEGNTVTTPTN